MITPLFDVGDRVKCIREWRGFAFYFIKGNYYEIISVCIDKSGNYYYSMKDKNDNTIYLYDCFIVDGFIDLLLYQRMKKLKILEIIT